MLSKRDLIISTFLAFAWFLGVSWREHAARSGAQAALESGARIVASSPRDMPAALQVLVEQHEFARMWVQDSQGGLIAEGKRQRASRLFYRDVELAPMSLGAGGLVRAVWIDGLLLGHLFLGLLMAGLGVLLTRARHARGQILLSAREEGLREAFEAADSKRRLEARLEMERFSARLTAQLMDLPSESIDAGVEDALCQLGVYAGAERCVIFLLRDEQRQLDYWAGWAASSVKETGMEGMRGMAADAFAWWMGKLREGEAIHIPDVDEMPAEAANERYILQLRHARAMAAAPLTAGGKLLGFVALVRIYQRQGWDEERLAALRLAGHLLGETLARREASIALNRLRSLEALVGNLSVGLLAATSAELDTHIERALADFAVFGECQRATLFLGSSDGQRLSATHEWAAAGVPRVLSTGQDLIWGGLPRLRAQLREQRRYTISDLQRLTDAAERSEWSRRGAAAFVCTALGTGTALDGMVCFEVLDGSRDWSVETLEMSRLAAGLFGAALARRRAEESLRQGVERQRLLLDLLPDLLLRVRLDGVLLDARLPRSEQGVDEGVLGQPLERAAAKLPGVGPGLIALIHHSLEAAASGNRASVVEAEGSSPQGPRWMEARILPAADGEAAVLIRDRTELRRQEAAHERLLANLLAIFNAGSRGLMLLSPLGVIEAFNHVIAESILEDLGVHLQPGMSLGGLIDPAESERYGRLFQAALQGQEPEEEMWAKLPKGGERRVRVQYLPVFSEQGAVRAVCMSVEYLDQLSRVETALRQSEDRYALAAQGSNDGMWDWDLVTGQFWVSDRWLEMLGLDRAEAPADLAAWVSLIHPEDRSLFDGRLQSHLSGGTAHLEVELRMLSQAISEPLWVQLRGLAQRDTAGKVQRLAGSQTDIHVRKSVEKSLLQDALTDPLTGLPNRALVLDRVGRCLARARRRQDYSFAVMALNTDHFKRINESLGHAAGDQLLEGVARRLEKALRPGDSVGRLGADEFVLLLDEIKDPQDTEVVAKRVRQEMEKPFLLSGREIFVSVSLGVSLGQGGKQSPEDLLRQAQTALARAKTGGHSAHLLYKEEMRAESVRDLELEAELRRGIQDRQFVLHYQPVVDLRTGQAKGFEALLRWQHPSRGLILPGEFIGLAESSGLVVDLGQWVIEEAARQAAQWQRRPGSTLSVSVNLSPRQLAHPDLLPGVRQALRAFGDERPNLVLEITETALMEDRQAAARALQALKELGLKVAVDDFGTGYSSLSYLDQFPVDTLKIDRSFVSRMDGLPQNEAVAGAVAALGRHLGLELIAEGIEREVQRERLMGLGCNYGQGFLFSRAVPPADAILFAERA